MESVYEFLIARGMVVFGVVLFLILTAICEIGFRLGRRHKAASDKSEQTVSATGTLAAGMLALLAFVMGLSISFAQNRFEARREQVVVEANTIGTAWLRARLVGGPQGDMMAKLIEDYAHTRLAYTVAPPNPRVIDALTARTGQQQEQIWVLATGLAHSAPTPITATLINALNDMIDSSLSQRFAYASKVPSMLGATLILGSILAIGAMGYQLGVGGVREPVLSSLLLLMWVGGILTAADLTLPRVGSIKVDPAPLVWTIEGFQSPAPSKTP